MQQQTKGGVNRGSIKHWWMISKADAEERRAYEGPSDRKPRPFYISFKIFSLPWAM